MSLIRLKCKVCDHIFFGIPPIGKGACPKCGSRDYEPDEHTEGDEERMNKPRDT